MEPVLVKKLEELEKTLGYPPYIVGKDNQGEFLTCRCCGTDFDVLPALLETRKIKDRKGLDVDVHACGECHYSGGESIELKAHIAKMRKELGLLDYPKGNKFRAVYRNPDEMYKFIIGDTGEVTELDDGGLCAAIEEKTTGMVVTTDTKREKETPPDEPEKVEEIKEVEVPTTTETEVILPDSGLSEEEIAAAEITDMFGDDDETNEILAAHGEPVSDESVVEEDDQPLPDGEAMDLDPENPTPVAAEESSGNLDDLFGNNAVAELPGEVEEVIPATPDPVITQETFNSDESALPIDKVIEVLGEEANASLDSLFGDDLENFTQEVEQMDSNVVETIIPEEVNPSLIDDKTDEFFKGGDDLTEVKLDAEPVNIRRNAAAAARPGGGASDVEYESDPQIDDMIKRNNLIVENDVFTTRLNTNDTVSGVIKHSRIADLHEDYKDSQFKDVVDRIQNIFKRRAKIDLQFDLIINDRTHECPVVDFEGNVRLIYVDLDVPGGKYDITAEVNRNIPRTIFHENAKYEMRTFVVFSDMLERGKLNKVVKGYAKHIAFALGRSDIFKSIGIIDDSDKYFYTTADHDKDTLTKFYIENSPGNVDKPHNGSLGVISQWARPDDGGSWWSDQDLRNRVTMAQGGDVGYEDLSMFMTATIRYIQLPKKLDGVINVTIVEYTEALNIFVRDGLGVCIGALIHKLKSQIPGCRVKIHYEIDPTTVPSPTIARYLKGGSIRELNIDPKMEQLNAIIKMTARHNGVQDPAQMAIEGEPFDSPEYKNEFWRSYMILPEFRNSNRDNVRHDFRKFGRKSFAKTLGSKFAEYSHVNVSDRKQRQAVLENLGFASVIQPPVMKMIVDGTFSRRAYATTLNKCSGFFSISQYMKKNRGSVVSDNYMDNNSNASTFDPSVASSEQMQDILKQQMLMKMMMNK